MPWKNWSSERLGIILAILAATGFSFKAIFVKLAYAASSIDAISLLCLRMTFTLPIVLWIIVANRRNLTTLKAGDWGLLVVLGLLGYYGSSVLDFLGLQYISAGLERLILFTYPTFTVLIGVFAMGKPLDRPQIIALSCSYVGIGLAFSHDLTDASDFNSVILGAAFVFGAAVSYALYSVGTEIAIGRIGAIRFSSLAILVSTGAIQIHFLISHPISALSQPISVYGYSVAMAIFSTVLPVFWLSVAVQRIGVTRTVLIGTLGPILTIFFGWWLLDEAVSVIQLLGSILVVAGVLVMTGKLRLRISNPVSG